MVSVCQYNKQDGQIDKAVYKLYNLDEGGIAIIKGGE
jgi:hypothetical protein